MKVEIIYLLILEIQCAESKSIHFPPPSCFGMLCYRCNKRECSKVIINAEIIEILWLVRSKYMFEVNISALLEVQVNELQEALTAHIKIDFWF